MHALYVYCCVECFGEYTKFYAYSCELNVLQVVREMNSVGLYTRIEDIVFNCFVTKLC